ncbi:unnamed protein product [Calypogeia fissa]
MDQVSYSHEVFTPDVLHDPNMIGPAGGMSVWVLGILVTLKAISNETGGIYSVFEEIVPPGAGAPMHMHTREEETWYLLDGEMVWTVGRRSFHATKGCLIHCPRLVPHYFMNKSGKPAHMINTYAPGGLEKWFLQVGEPVLDRYAPGEPPPRTKVLLNKAIKLAQEEYGVLFNLGQEAAKDEL